MINRLFSFALVAALALLCTISAASAQGRTALVIGNNSYPFGPLANPINDASDMAAALRSAGFDVVLKTNADQRSTSDAIRAFGDALKRKGGVGLFFFAGHGAQLGGENYLIPIADGFAGERELKERANNASEVVDAMAAARNDLNIIVLDACRNNPLSSSATRGLNRIDTNARLFVSYSTSPGAVALDGQGRNSPYTKHLAQAISVADIPLEDTFKRTLKGVYQETAGKQTPWISSSFFGDFVFRPGGPGAQSAALQTAPKSALPRTGTLPTLAGIYRAAGTNPNRTRYAGMAAVNQAGDQFKVQWWIGAQVFNGSGQFAGRMLVINWGASSPVVYSFVGGDTLDGEWADGTATDRLELFARAADTEVPLPHGVYRINGRNPNGTNYSGRVAIASSGGRSTFEWQVGTQTYRGAGARSGNILSIDWGSKQPIVYALAADGTLKGLWDGGKGEEVLTPER
jgi:Caspase domain